MGDHLARANKYEKRAEKKLSPRVLFGFTVFSPNRKAAARLYDKAAEAFEQAESWDRAGAVYVKLANCHLEMNSKLEAADNFTYAFCSYEKSKSIPETISCLERAAQIYQSKVKFDISAKYYMKIAQVFEEEKNLEKVIFFNEKGANLFKLLRDATSASRCRLRIAKFAAEIEQYPKAIEIFEGVARESFYDKSLKYGTKGLLLDAGICQLCKGDDAATENALERYLALDPAFQDSREYRLLVDLGSAVREKDASKFAETAKKYDSLRHLGAFETALLLRVTEAIKAKEVEEDGAA